MHTTYNTGSVAVTVLASVILTCNLTHKRTHIYGPPARSALPVVHPRGHIGNRLSIAYKSHMLLEDYSATTEG